VSAPTDHPTDRRHIYSSGAVSRPSKNNCHGAHESLTRENLGIAPEEMPEGTGLRPLSVEPDRSLREEAVHELSSGTQARPWYAVLSEWRDWYDSYLRMNIEFEGPNGETARTRLKNSYQPEYGKRYYAKLKDLERGINREYESLTTVMLTFTASNENDQGGPRCPADHMRDIMEGYDAARKQLHKVLDGRTWQYARVWEPHDSGYGHLHLAVFVEDTDADLGPGDFAPVMRSHVKNCTPAGWKAHRPSGDSVSLNDDVENLGSYISEYIGIFGEEVLERPITEQMFYATCWATGTRRVDFSNGSHEMMAKEQFRRETGLRPEDRGGRSFEAWRATGDPDNVAAMGESDTGGSGARESDESGPSAVAESAEGTGWTVTSICTVRARRPEYSDPTTGGVDTKRIDGRPGVDRPAERH